MVSFGLTRLFPAKNAAGVRGRGSYIMWNPWNVATVVIPVMSARVAAVAGFRKISARVASPVTVVRKTAGVAGRAEKMGKWEAN